MKFNNTYSLLEFLIENGKEIKIELNQYQGDISATVSVDIDTNTKLHLEERFSNLVHKIMDENGWNFNFDGNGTIEKGKKGLLNLLYEVRNEAFPSEEFGNTESNSNVVYGLLSCLYECLKQNNVIKNHPEDEDFEYEMEFYPIPLNINFIIHENKIENYEIELFGEIGEIEINELDETVKKDIIFSLHEHIKNDTSGAFLLTYSEGDSMEVSFDASVKYLSIFDIGLSKINIIDYFKDELEYVLDYNLKE